LRDREFSSGAGRFSGVDAHATAAESESAATAKREFFASFMMGCLWLFQIEEGYHSNTSSNGRKRENFDYCLPGIGLRQALSDVGNSESSSS
jgi:hypothetical protein